MNGFANRGNGLKWRWDQGRLRYFHFPEICNSAKSLWSVNGRTIPLSGQTDFLRKALSNHSSLPFAAPGTHSVWRNYSRLFGSQLLATEINRVLVCTDVCAALAEGALDFDSYLFKFANNFAYPCPVFADYQASSRRVFPVAAVVKAAIAGFIAGHSSQSVDELVRAVKSSAADGTEGLSFYSALSTERSVSVGETEWRQIREMLAFATKFSFLRLERGQLVVGLNGVGDALKIFERFSPQPRVAEENPSAEVLRMGELGLREAREDEGADSLNTFDIQFVAGDAFRILHLHGERSSHVAEIFFSRAPHPSVCDMCRQDTLDHYPATNRLIQPHHLLPLSSPVRIEAGAAVLEDFIGLCPTCHEAVHRYYASWLNGRLRRDFANRSEAVAVYEEAKAHFSP